VRNEALSRSSGNSPQRCHPASRSTPSGEGQRVSIFAEVDGKPFDAIHRIEEFKQYAKDRDLLTNILRLLILVNRCTDARRILGESSFTLTPKTRDIFERDILEATDNYDGALAVIRRQCQKSYFPAKYAVYETHNLLKLSRWSEAESVARKVLNPAHFSNEYDSIIIHLEISVQRQGRRVDKGRLARLIEDDSVSAIVRMCAHFLLDDKAKATEALLKALK
jgi:hypothetical protein